MEFSGRVATWLELAVAPEWRKQRSTVKVHPMHGERGGCFALSMDGRWLCASSGQLTIFKGLAAALHFLKAVKVEDFQPGEPLEMPGRCNGSSYCLELNKQNRLSACSRACQAHRLAA